MDQYQTYKQEQPISNHYTGYAGSPQQPPTDNSYSHISSQINGYQQQEYQHQPYPSNDNAQSFVPPEQRERYEQQARAQSGSLFVGTHGSLAGLCYVGFWLTGLLVLLFEHKNRLMRFHAMQSLLLFGGVNILYIVLIRIMIDQTPFVFGFAIFAFVIMNIVAAVSWFVGMIGAFSGKYTKLPFVGDIAERYVNRTTPVNPHL